MTRAEKSAPRKPASSGTTTAGHRGEHRWWQPRGLVRPHERWPAVARFDRRTAKLTDAMDLGEGTDVALRRLSDAASHAKLWVGVSGGLALTGPRGRRAATRGLGSLAVASLLANVLGKTVFGGERPTGAGLSVLRRLEHAPTSSSFPSGHSASAAAFVTGVALEWPTMGLALSPLAGAVCYSRLHVGAHWASDVIAGAALGTGVALVGRALVPGRARTTDPRAPGPAADAPALPGGEGLYVIVNPSSGRDPVNPNKQRGGPRAKPPAERIAALLPHATVHVLEKDEWASDVARQALADGARALGVCGGDGTVGSVAGVAREKDVPLALFPGGTLNHFAKALHLTDELHDGNAFAAAADAVQHGRATAVDVAVLSIGDDPAVTVLNTFSIGIYPTLVERREKLEHRLGKWLAAVVATVQTLPGAQPVQVTTADGNEPVWSAFAGIDRYRPGGLVPAERGRVDDGVLDERDALAGNRARRALLLVENASKGVSERVSSLTRHLRREKASSASGFVTRERERVEIGVPDGTPVAHDGETKDAHSPTGGRVPLLLAMHPGALTVYVEPDTEPRTDAS